MSKKKVFDRKNNYKIAIYFIFSTLAKKLSIITKLPPQFLCKKKVCHGKSTAIMMTNLIFWDKHIWNDNFSQTYMNDKFVSISLLNEVANLLYFVDLVRKRFISQIYCDDTTI